MNIVETADAAGSFATLIAAAKAAGLAGTLSNDGPFTVFAPTDAAFEALPVGTIETLLKPENKAQLATILKFHVLAGNVGSSALADGLSVETLSGDKATIAASEGGFTIENARIVSTDIKTSNGTIHVIDRVILPPQKMSRSDAPQPAGIRVIEAAVDAGVPLFNHGNPEATAAIYRVAVKSLLSFSGAAALDDATIARLQRGSERADMQNDARQQAWTLRYALDDARRALSGNANAAMAMQASAGH
ncbi:MAG: fasciclin domain-containing protein [Pseudomonadota bacterium]